MHYLYLGHNLKTAYIANPEFKFNCVLLSLTCLMAKRVLENQWVGKNPTSFIQNKTPFLIPQQISSS